MTQNTQNDKVIVRVEGKTGLLELNRPKALNSLDSDMVVLIDDALKKWKDDDAVEQVVIFSGSERAFCAGGDVRQAREACLEGNYQEGDDFFAKEYVMNGDMAEFPKPYIALLDGVVMGGGLGISVHGSHRIITERAFAAMPEMAIGFIPDVGVPYFFEHMDVGINPTHRSHALAVFLTTTGWHMKPADMLFTGVATHFVPSEKIEDLRQAILADGVDAAVSQHCLSREQLVTPEGKVIRDADDHQAIADLEDSELAKYIEDIEHTFDHDSFAEIEAAVEAHSNTAFADLVREKFSVANPASLVAATELHAAIADCDGIREELELERVLGQLMRRDDNFVEGVRAVLVDKDRNATFSPDNTADVDVSTYRDVLKQGLAK